MLVFEAEVLRCLVFVLTTCGTTVRWTHKFFLPALGTGPSGHMLHMVFARRWSCRRAADTGWEATFLAVICIFQERRRWWWEGWTFPAKACACFVSTGWIFALEATPAVSFDTAVRPRIAVNFIPLPALIAPEVAE